MGIDSGRDIVASHAQAPEQKETPKARQLPITLLSGFLVGPCN